MNADTHFSPQRSVIGVVLAGGQSHRMRRDKALLQIGNVTLLEHSKRCLYEAGCTNVIVSGRISEGESILDEFPGYGPVSGIHAALCHFPDKRLLFVPVDMPRLSVTCLKVLLQQHTHSPCLHYHYYPLPLRIDATFVACRVATQLLSDPHTKHSVKRLTHLMHAETLVLEETHLSTMLNCNTPEDWKRFYDEMANSNSIFADPPV